MSLNPVECSSDLPVESKDQILNSSINLYAVEFPESGIKAWLVVLGSFCAMLMTFGYVNTAAVFESYWSTHQLQDRSSSQIGWIFSIYLFVVYLVGMQVGPIFDRYGATVLVIPGCVLIAASPFVLAECTEYYQFILSFSLLGGLGGALLNTPAMASVAHYFNEKRGLAIGLATTAGSLGGIVFPLILQQLIPKIGFAWSVRVLGFIFYIGIKTSNIRPKIGIFRNLKLVLLCLCIFFIEYGVLLPMTYIVSYATSYGQVAISSYQLVALFNAGSVAGRVIPGLISDRLGRFNVLSITLILCVVSDFGLWLPANGSMKVVNAFVVVLGFSSGSNVSLIPVCTGQLCNIHEYGGFLSMAMVFSAFGTLTSIPAGGALLDDKDSDASWRHLIMFSGFSYIASLFCCVAIRILAVGSSIRKVF